MGTPIHTKTEYYVQSLLKFLDIPYETDRILCFSCNGARFYWCDNSLPSQCAIGLHPLTKGGFMIPDIILLDKRGPMPMPLTTFIKGYEPYKISILRIDGWIHDKRRIKARDRGQERELLRLGIPYFVAENEFFAPIHNDKSKIPRAHLDFLLSCWQQTLNSELYDKYQKIKDVRDTKLV